MIKLNANVSKKVPIEGLDFSSQSYMAGMEVEVADGASAEEISTKLRQVYVLLEQTIDAEIEKSNSVPESQPVEAPKTSPRWNNSQPRQNYGNNGGNGKSNGRSATAAQVKAIFAIAKANGISRNDLLERIDAEFDVGKPEELSIKTASKFIESLSRENDRCLSRLRHQTEIDRNRS